MEYLRQLSGSHESQFILQLSWKESYQIIICSFGFSLYMQYFNTMYYTRKWCTCCRFITIKFFMIMSFALLIFICIFTLKNILLIMAHAFGGTHLNVTMDYLESSTPIKKCIKQQIMRKFVNAQIFLLQIKSSFLSCLPNHHSLANASFDETNTLLLMNLYFFFLWLQFSNLKSMSCSVTPTSS